MAEREPVPTEALMEMLQAMRTEMRDMGQQVGTLRQEFGDRLGRLEQPQGQAPRAAIRGQPRQQQPPPPDQGEEDGEEFPDLAADFDPQPAQPNRRLEPLWRNQPRDTAPRETNHEVKLTPPSFAGKTDPEAYLDWERQMEYIFECYGYGDHKRVALAAAQLTGNALAWWDRTVAERRRMRFGAVTTWANMKYLMRLRYVPEHYHRDLQKRFRKLMQGQRSVEDYFEEFEKLMNSLELEESEEAMMAQFIDGLQERIQRKVERSHYSSLHELLHLAVQIEQQIKRKNSLNNRNRNANQPWNPSLSKPQDKGKAIEVDSRFRGKPTEAPKTFRAEQGKSTNPPVRSRDIICFKCQGRGHISRDCPNNRVMILTHDGDYESQDEQEEEPPELYDEVQYPDTGEMLVIRRMLSALVDPEEKVQRENIFHTRCTIQNKVCNLIIDGGSCTNVASRYMVSKLGLKTTKHPRPYKLRWLKNQTELKIDEQVTIPFSVGKYQDEVVCDVVPMQAGHLLLGRPWQFDRATNHNGRTNYYSFVHKNCKYNLAPLSPSEVHEMQVHMSKEAEVSKSSLFVSSNAICKTLSANGTVLLMVYKECLSQVYMLKTYLTRSKHCSTNSKMYFQKRYQRGCLPFVE